MIDIWGRQNHPLQAAVGCVPYAKKIIHIERSFNMIYSHEVEMKSRTGSDPGRSEMGTG